MGSAAEVCPYPGLVPYEVGMGALFFGRDADVAACRAALRRTGVVAVVGPAGCGKTSLVQAGVVPALISDGYAVRRTSPGPHPHRDLVPGDALGWAGADRAELGRAPECLVVDQLEEALAPGVDQFERAASFAALERASRRGLLVLAVRAESLGAMTSYHPLARLLERSVHLLGPLTGEQLAEAIEGPARRAGLHFEPGLVDRLHHEFDGSALGLPLLAHALRRLWERRRGPMLTLEAYDDMGGVRGAVALSAESVYEDIAEDQRPLLRDLILRLVEPSPAGGARCVRLSHRVAAFGPVRARMVERLVAAGLVVRTGEDVRLAHDAVVAAWPRLRSWIDDDLDGWRVRRHLAVAADDWHRLGRPDSELYRGVRLSRAVEWNQRARPALLPSERAFLSAAEAAAAAERRDTEARLRAEAASNRRLRVLAAGIAALLVVAMVAGGLAVLRAERADRAAAGADARRIGAQALATPAVDRALLLAAEAARLDDSPDTRASLLRTIARHALLVGSVRSSRPLSAVAVSPDDRLVAVGAASGGLTVYDTATLTRQASVGVPVTRAAFSPNGSTIAVATGAASGRNGGGSAVVLVDAASGAIDRLPAVAPAGPATGVAFVDEGRLVVAFEPYAFDQSMARPATTSTVVVWDLAAGDARRFTVAGTQPTLALDAAGALAYVGTIRGGSGPWVSVIDVATGATVRQAPVDARPVAVSPDGSMLAGIDGHDAVLMRSDRLAEELRLEAHRPLVQDGSFSADGRRFVTAGQDGTATVWDVRPSLGAAPDDGQVPRRVVELTGHTGQVSGTALGGDGATLFTVAVDELLLVWDLAGERRLLARDTTASAAPRPRPSMRHTDAGIELRAPGTQLAVRAPVPFNGTVRAMFPSLDWERAAVITTDRTIAIVDFSRSVIAGSIRVGWTPVSAAFSPDGRALAVTGSDGQVALVDVDSTSWRAPPVLAHHGEASSVEWSADGALFATGGADGRVGLWDGASGAAVGLVDVGLGGDEAAVHFDDHDVVIDAGATYRFDTRVSAWIDHACAVAGRSLTAEEWTDSFGDDGYRETCPGE